MPSRPYPVRSCSSLTRRSIEWLWDPYVPRGALSVLVGDPNIGKTWIATALAARISRAEGTTLYVSAEDDPSGPLLDRFAAASARLDALYVSDEPLALADSRDFAGFRDTARALAPRLLVLDPLQAFFPDTNAMAEMRPPLTALRALAVELNCAVLLLAHMRKASASTALYRVGGSIDIAAAARSVLVATTDPASASGGRLLAQIKNAYAPYGPTLCWHVEGTGPSARVQWDGQSTLTGADALGAGQGRPAHARMEAEDWLLMRLSDGPVRAADLYREGEERGLSRSTLKRAALAVGVHRDEAGWQLLTPGSGAGVTQGSRVQVHHSKSGGPFGPDPSPEGQK